MPKYTKKDRDNIAENLAVKCVCGYSKAAPAILRLAAHKAKQIIDKAKQKQY